MYMNLSLLYYRAKHYVEVGFSPARIEGIANGRGLGGVYDHSSHQRNMDIEVMGDCYGWGEQ